MYYDRILKIWVIDQIDIFLLSFTVGNVSYLCLKYYLKDYLSERKVVERLKNSIIKKSELLVKSYTPIFNSNSKEMKIKIFTNLQYQIVVGN